MFHISKLLLTPLLWGEASFCHILQPAGGGRSLLLLFFLFLFLLLLFFKMFYQFRIIFALTSCWWLWKTMSFVFSAQWLASSWNLLATVKSFPTQLLLSVNACMLSTCAWNLSRMLGYQELTNACDVVMNPTKIKKTTRKYKRLLQCVINSTLFDLNITLL